MSDEEGCLGCGFLTALFTILMVVIFLGTDGCSNNSPSPGLTCDTKQITSLDDLQGTWKVVEATDPKGVVYNADDMQIVITKSEAKCGNDKLKLAFNGDGSYLQMKDASGKVVGEVAVTQTVGKSPTQMLWEDRTNSQQHTVLEKK
jgi:hypothetical protein